MFQETQRNQIVFFPEVFKGIETKNNSAIFLEENKFFIVLFFCFCFSSALPPVFCLRRYPFGSQELLGVAARGECRYDFFPNYDLLRFSLKNKSVQLLRFLVSFEKEQGSGFSYI